MVAKMRAPLVGSRFLACVLACAACALAAAGAGGAASPVQGCLGGAFGMVFHHAWPALVPNPASFAIVGMAGFFGGIAHAPISTVVMVSEMTGNYRLLVPALWVCAITFLLTQRVSLYRKQVAGWSQSGAHRHEMLAGLIHDRRVRDAMRAPDLAKLAALRPEAIVHLEPSTPLEIAVAHLERPGAHLVVAVDPLVNAQPVGMLSRRDVITEFESALRRRFELESPAGH